MSKTSKTFCPLPFVHLYAQPSGHVKPCCIAETIYTHNLNNETINIYGDGNQIRSWCYIDDFVDCLLKIIANKKCIGD